MGGYIPLKNYFDTKLAERLACLISPFYPVFPSESFIDQIKRKVEGKELKERVEVIAVELRQALPEDYESAVSILLLILGPENKTEKGMFANGYFLMPVAHYIEKYGLEHVDVSLLALYEITKRHTAEYAIRPYLIQHSSRTIDYLDKWKSDDNAHIRRLVSEGTRPRLPWAKKMDYLNGDIQQNLYFLEKLKNDSSSYVRKSVGNHLNDLSKDEPESVLLWIEERKSCLHPEVMKRGVRTLVKKENRRAIELL